MEPYQVVCLAVNIRLGQASQAVTNTPAVQLTALKSFVAQITEMLNIVDVRYATYDQHFMTILRMRVPYLESDRNYFKSNFSS